MYISLNPYTIFNILRVSMIIYIYILCKEKYYLGRVVRQFLNVIPIYPCNLHSHKKHVFI